MRESITVKVKNGKEITVRPQTLLSNELTKRMCKTSIKGVICEVRKLQMKVRRKFECDQLPCKQPYRFKEPCLLHKKEPGIGVVDRPC